MVEHNDTRCHPDAETLEIYTDGSCWPNPGPGGWGLVVVDGEFSICRKQGTAKETTNNRMEFQALIEALKLAKWWHTKDITIWTDSQYAMNCITQWAEGWIKRGWKTSQRKPVKNQDLIQEAWDLYKEVKRKGRVRIDWVKGHSDHPWNDTADQLAEEARLWVTT